MVDGDLSFVEPATQFMVIHRDDRLDIAMVGTAAAWLMELELAWTVEEACFAWKHRARSIEAGLDSRRP